MSIYGIPDISQQWKTEQKIGRLEVLWDCRGRDGLDLEQQTFFWCN